jgi:hypothetical protein
VSLVLLGVWLAALGICDLGRASHDTVGHLRRAGCLAAGWLVLLVGIVAVHPGTGWALLLLALLGSLLTSWLVASDAALGPAGAGRRRTRSRRVAFASVLAGTAVSVLGVQALGRVPGWPTWVDRTLPAQWPVPGVAVALGVVTVQLATVNILVRLLLDAVGVPATTNEKQLKGGRILGPMERVFIVGLGAVGAPTAAAVVVAAKGLLRFPELQRAQRGHPARDGASPDGPSDVTEYFLIGSFASWLLALGGAALIVLA